MMTSLGSVVIHCCWRASPHVFVKLSMLTCHCAFYLKRRQLRSWQRKSKHTSPTTLQVFAVLVRRRCLLHRNVYGSSISLSRAVAPTTYRECFGCVGHSM